MLEHELSPTQTDDFLVWLLETEYSYLDVNAPYRDLVHDKFSPNVSAILLHLAARGRLVIEEDVILKSGWRRVVASVNHPELREDGKETRERSPATCSKCGAVDDSQYICPNCRWGGGV